MKKKCLKNIFFAGHLIWKKFTWNILCFQFLIHNYFDLKTVIDANLNNSDVFLQLSCFSKKAYLWIVSKAPEAISCPCFINFQWLLGAFHMILSKTTYMVIAAILKLPWDHSKKGKMYLLTVFPFNLMVMMINTFSPTQTDFKWKITKKYRAVFNVLPE